MSIGLYIHVPFCLKKCNYCDFVSYPYDKELARDYVSALQMEMSQHVVNMCCDNRVLKSIYLGGGTPTTLTALQMKTIMDLCRQYFTVPDEAEITVECNPCSVNSDKLQELRRAGVNRLSIGVQACQQELLAFLGRSHGWEEVVNALRNSREAGFDNISCDLIFGIPGQSMENWQESLKKIAELLPQHISAYNLKIEPDTPLHRDVSSGYLVPCDEELELEMYWYAVKFLAESGFNHYEISNFARPGREAKHNLLYWHNEDYLGLGPAAHSMLKGHRFSNIESVELYIRKLQRKESVIHALHSLSREERMSETVFLGLRLIGGLDLEAFEKTYGDNIFNVYGEQIKKFTALGLLEVKGTRLRLTEKGLPVSNVVFADFV